MSYRDDLDAAQARAEAAERRARQLEGELTRLRDRSVDPLLEERAPARYETSRTDREVTLRWRWFKGLPSVLLLAFVAVWDLLWFPVAMQKPASAWLLGGALGIGLTYYALTHLFNRTKLSVTAEQIVVTHGPLPWVRTRTLRRTDIRNIGVSSVLSGGSDQGAPTETWSVRAHLDDGRYLTVVDGLDNRGEADYIARTCRS